MLLLQAHRRVLAQEPPGNIQALPLLEKYVRRLRFVTAAVPRRGSIWRECMGSVSNGHETNTGDEEGILTSGYRLSKPQQVEVLCPLQERTEVGRR